jgi:hypothetical protein
VIKKNHIGLWFWHYNVFIGNCSTLCF